MKVGLETALRRHKFVTVETADGDVYVGTLVAVSFEHVKVCTGVQGKPPVLHVDDIETLRTVDKRNPHVAQRTSRRVTVSR